MKDDWCVHVQGLEPFPETENAKPLLFWDFFVPGNYFYATTDRIKDAMYHLNRNFNKRGIALYSEFLDFIHVEPTEDSKNFGWCAWKMAEEGWNTWIDFCIYKNKDEDWYTIDYIYYPEHVSEWEEYE